MMVGEGDRFRLPQRIRPRVLDFALPTINIIFLLTLYFLLAGTLAAQNEVVADLPLSQNARLERLPRPLLTIAEDGRMMVDGLAVTPSDVVMAAELALNAAPPGARLNVMAPRLADARPIFSLLAKLALNGIPARVVTQHLGAGNAAK